MPQGATTCTAPGLPEGDLFNSHASISSEHATPPLRQRVGQRLGDVGEAFVLGHDWPP